MATPRSLWKGQLKLSLVSVPAKLYSASEPKAKVSFNRLHADCTGPTQNKVWCPACAVEVPHDQTIKGYRYGGKYLTFSEDELDAIAASASNALEITHVTSDPLNPIYIDGTLYLVPDQGAQQAFETIKQALGARTAIGTIVMRDRTLQVALVPQADSQVFLVYKLRAASQVRDLANIEHGSMAIVPPKNDVALAKQLLDSLDGPFSFDDVADDYNDKVKALLESKINGTAPVVMPAAVAPKVASLQEALTESLKLAAQKQAAKAALPAKAAPAKAALKPAKATKKKAS
jgi:DNA end-binding protein Ku